MSAFQVKPELDPLEREKREIERRRARLEDRRLRILHAKTRVIGIDVNSLSEQVREREERERLEQERNLYLDEQSNGHARIMTQLEMERKNEERRKLDELTQYRKQQLAEKKQKELIEKSGLNNLSDADTLFLKFPGEDLGKNDRVRAQQEQQQEWLAAQLAIQREKEGRDRQDAADYAQTQKQILELQSNIHNEHKQDDRKRAIALQTYNQTLYNQRRAELRNTALKNQSADDDEIQATLHSQLLNEAVTQHAYEIGKTVPYNFKGFTTAKRQSILDEQARQQEELRQRREKSWQEEKQYAEQQEDIRRNLIKAERERNEQAQQRLQALKQERLTQKKEKDLRDQYFNNVVNTNPVTEEYFGQFGTSCR